VEVYLAYTSLFAITFVKSSIFPHSIAVYQLSKLYAYWTVDALLGATPPYVAVSQ
jgi:hypothetical protein